MRVATCTYGATITEIAVADRAGVIENVVCGFNSVEGYVAQPQFFGAMIGPFAGRLENSEVVLNGQVIQVEANDGAHLLHGGQGKSLALPIAKKPFLARVRLQLSTSLDLRA